MSDFLATLRSLVGPAHVLTEGDLTAYERDWRGRLHGKALAVVRPANTGDNEIKTAHRRGHLRKSRI